MKKIYVAPTTYTVKIKVGNVMVSYSSSEASSSAVSLSRESNDSWDEE